VHYLAAMISAATVILAEVLEVEARQGGMCLECAAQIAARLA
jgi:hypothetical protein